MHLTNIRLRCYHFVVLLNFEVMYGKHCHLCGKWPDMEEQSPVVLGDSLEGRSHKDLMPIRTIALLVLGTPVWSAPKMLWVHSNIQDCVLNECIAKEADKCFCLYRVVMASASESRIRHHKWQDPNPLVGWMNEFWRRQTSSSVFVEMLWFLPCGKG